MDGQSNPTATTHPHAPTPMPRLGAPGVRLVSTGMYLPEKVLTNHDLTQMVDTSEEWIIQRTGIRERRILAEDQNTRHMAIGSMRQALDRAGMKPTDLDMLILATLSPEMVFPATAARVVAELGAVPAGAMDISVACSGFVYGMNLAYSLIRTGACRTVGVIGAELLSRITNWKDRNTCVLFGDGAGAAIVTACDDPARGCLHQSMHSDGNLWTELYCPRTHADIPPGDKVFNGQLNTLQMNGREVYKFAVSTLQKCIDDTLAAVGIRPSDLAMVIPHQSNIRILESARDKMGLPPEKLCINIDRFGNTSAASVPIALHELHQAGRIKDNDLVLFVALGGGMTWAASLWRV